MEDPTEQQHNTENPNTLPGVAHHAFTKPVTTEEYEREAQRLTQIELDKLMKQMKDQPNQFSQAKVFRAKQAELEVKDTKGNLSIGLIPLVFAGIAIILRLFMGSRIDELLSSFYENTFVPVMCFPFDLRSSWPYLFGASIALALIAIVSLNMDKLTNLCTVSKEQLYIRVLCKAISANGFMALFLIVTLGGMNFLYSVFNDVSFCTLPENTVKCMKAVPIIGDALSGAALVAILPLSLLGLQNTIVCSILAIVSMFHFFLTTALGTIEMVTLEVHKIARAAIPVFLSVLLLFTGISHFGVIIVFVVYACEAALKYLVYFGNKQTYNGLKVNESFVSHPVMIDPDTGAAIEPETAEDLQ